MQREIRLDHCWAPTSGAQPHCVGQAMSPQTHSPPLPALTAPWLLLFLLSIVRPILMRRGGTKQTSTEQALGRGSNGKDMLLLWGDGDSGQGRGNWLNNKPGQRQSQEGAGHSCHACAQGCLREQQVQPPPGSCLLPGQSHGTKPSPAETLQ